MEKKRCDGTYIKASDPAACCLGGDLVPCPSSSTEASCKENTEATGGGGVKNINRKGRKSNKS